MSDRLHFYFLCSFPGDGSGLESEAAANVPKLIKIEINIGPLAKSIKQSQHALSGLSIPFLMRPGGRHPRTKNKNKTNVSKCGRAKVRNSVEPYGTGPTNKII